MLPKSLRPLFPYLRKYRGSYFIGTICVFINNGVWILFPLVLFVLPSMIAVIVGPAMIQVVRTLSAGV